MGGADWNILEKLWPLLAGMAALWARLEIGQALNRANIHALWKRRDEDRDTLARTLDQIREDYKSGRKEFHDEIRSLRETIERLAAQHRNAVQGRDKG